MNIQIPMTIPKNILRYLTNPLLQNSLFMMCTSALNAGFGFVFWMIAAKIYPPEDLGVSTALISSMGLLVIFSRLGLDFATIRFFPSFDKNRVFNTSLIITTGFAVVFGLIFIIGIDTFSPELEILKSPYTAFIYLIFLIANSMVNFIGISFVAIRKARFQFLQSVLTGTRILFLFPLITLGALGIFNAIGVSFLITLLVTLLIIVKYGIKLQLKVDYPFLNKAIHFSFANYLAAMFTTAPNQLLPIIVLNTLGAEDNAYYYIAFAIVSLLFMIPSSISMSLFVEGSHGENLKSTVIKSVISMFAALTPALLLIYFGSNFLLDAIGKSYSTNGIELLRIMSFASIFMIPTSLYFSVKRIQKKIKELVIVSGTIFLILIGSSYTFMLKYGLLGVGYAWILSYIIGAIIVICLIWKEKWI